MLARDAAQLKKRQDEFEHCAAYTSDVGDIDTRKDPLRNRRIDPHAAYPASISSGQTQQILCQTWRYRPGDVKGSPSRPLDMVIASGIETVRRGMVNK